MHEYEAFLVIDLAHGLPGEDSLQQLAEQKGNKMVTQNGSRILENDSQHGSRLLSNGSKMDPE